MSTRFPATGIDDSSTLPNPATNNFLNSPTHAGLHGNANDAIKAVETKLGTGATTPASATLLIGTGAGTSAWSALTSSQLAGLLSDETGTGSAVFATTPTLVTPKVDTINEATGGNGTTIGGVNIKSGALVTTNSVVTANITDTSITPAKLQAGTGTTWAWQTWAPTLTNLSGGTLTSAKFVQIGKTVHFELFYSLTGANISGSVKFTLPVAAGSSFNTPLMPIGQAIYENSGVATYMGYVNMGIDGALSTTTATILVHNAAGTYLSADTQLSATVPHTWKNNDKIRISGAYEAA